MGLEFIVHSLGIRGREEDCQRPVERGLLVRLVILAVLVVLVVLVILAVLVVLVVLVLLVLLASRSSLLIVPYSLLIDSFHSFQKCST